METLLRWRVVVLIVVGVLTALAWPLASRLEFDQSIESLYARDDLHFSEFARSKDTFGGDEFAIVAWREPGLFAADGSISEASRVRLEAIAEKLQAVPGVVPGSVQHVADALKFPYARDEVTGMVEGILIGRDRQTTAIVTRLERTGDGTETGLHPKPSRGETIAMIRAIAAEHDPPAFVVGEPVQIHDMFRIVEDDGRTLFYWSLLILGTVLFAMLRTLRWVIFPLIVVVLSIRWTEALMVLFGARLSMVSSMLNSLVTIIGVATATHLAIGLRSRLATLPRQQALLATIIELLPSIFWTCVTTAVGFAALLSSNITPVKSFGLMMTVATGLVFVIVALLTPALMSRCQPASVATSSEGTPDADSGEEERRGSAWYRRLWHLLAGDPRPASAERHLVAALSGVSSLVERRPGFVAAAAVGVVVFCGTGLFRLNVETDFSRNFRDSSELVRSLNFVESHLGGAGTWEVNFAAPSELTDEYLEQVRTLAARLRAELLIEGDPGALASKTVPRADDVHGMVEPASAEGRLTKVVCLTDGLDLIPSEVGIGFLKRRLPVEQRLSILATMQNDLLSSLYNADSGRMRIVLRGLERQTSARKLELIARVEQIAGDVLGHADPSHSDEWAAAELSETTGLFVLLTFLIESLLRDQVVSFLIAAAGIGTMMSIAFRSLRIGLISIVPNVFPIVLVLGSMGWLNVPVNIATAMIASVSMGLTVDSSIHYLAAWQRARQRGASMHDAIEHAQTQVGLALVFANVALVTGFSVLAASQFIPLVYFGVLVSVAMLGGLAGNMFLLPLLLALFCRHAEGSER